MPIYFNDETEQQIIRYNRCRSPKVKNDIYNYSIKHSFEKLVENIIYTFKLHSKVDDYKTLKDKTIGDLIIKMKKFNHRRGKAYSFFGTTAKNFILMELKKENKHITLDDLDSNENSNPNSSMSEMPKNTKIILEKFSITDDSLEKKEKKEVIIDFLRTEQKNNDLNIDIMLLDAIEFAFLEQMDISNKKALFLFLRESTSLSTPEISGFLNKFRPKFREYLKKYQNGEI